MCVCVCVCACVRAYRLVRVSAGAGRGKQHNVYCSSALHFMTPTAGALAELGAGLAANNPRDPPVSASLSTGVIGSRVTTHWAFYVGDGSSCLCSEHFTPDDPQDHPAS